jgi:hypothetical protein
MSLFKRQLFELLIFFFIATEYKHLIIHLQFILHIRHKNIDEYLRKVFQYFSKR